VKRHIPAKLRRLAVERAGERCEYCGLSQAGQAATFHLDHIDPIVAGGATTADNLALACASCSLRKGARRAVSDPETRQTVSLFHPRQQVWSEHFRWDGVRLVGLTPTGRATIAALAMNRPAVLPVRMQEEASGWHPPD
jgi:HNH endonuclease